MNILPEEVNCIWASRLIGFPIKMSEAGARASQLSDQAAPNKQIGSPYWFRYGFQDNMFQVAIFSINVDAIREQKCCISHSPTELMFIKFPCNDSTWKISANMHRHMERVMYWKQFWRLCISMPFMIFERKFMT